MHTPAHGAAIVVAGGSSRRLGGIDKPALVVGGRSMLQVALDAVAGVPVVVVGPDRDVPSGVTVIREQPAGGGPAAAIAAGLTALPDEVPADALVVILAADLPAMDGAAVHRLCAAVHDAATVAGAMAGAVLLDVHGRRQFLAGAWRHADLASAVARRADWHGRSVRELLLPIAAVEVPGCEYATVDVDTPDDWRALPPAMGPRRATPEQHL